METIAEDMHIGGRKGSGGKFLSETNTGRVGSLEAGRVLQSRQAGG